MLERLNQTIFSWVNATPHSLHFLIILATYLAQYLILVIPLIFSILWFWGSKNCITVQRKLVLKTVIAIIISLLISYSIRKLFPHERPFTIGLGYVFLKHSKSNSFPSNHGTIIFACAIAFSFWHRIWSGIIIFFIGIVIAWSRIYLGLHWPLDMLSALLSSSIGCISSQYIWYICGKKIFQLFSYIYRYCFAFPIRKGWIRY
ncbi:MAG: undecaprenyl-diphosphate phosphatase [Candidatus Dasytiphilus stammeri]